MAENGKCLKVVGKVFLMIKNGPGFMVSQMHSLFNKVVDSGDVVGGDGDHTGSAPSKFSPSDLYV